VSRAAASAAVVLVVVALIAVAPAVRPQAGGGPATSITPTQTPSDSPGASPTTANSTHVAVATTRTSEPGSTPGPYISEHERSELFWAGVSHFGLYGQTYDSLVELTRAAELVVRGSVTDFRPGVIQPFGADLPGNLGAPLRTVFGIVTIDEVLKGEPVSRTTGTIEVAELGWPDMSVADLPQDEVILFVMNHAQQRVDLGVPPSKDPDDRFHYERPNGYQCVLRNVDGNVEIIEGPRGWKEAFGPFPSQLDGRRFEDVVDRVRQIALGSP
jgi:hypothetical protein